MKMVPPGLTTREPTYAPRTPSPLNPLSTETQPRLPRRSAKHEPSPAQILMRKKAAAARRLMSSHGALVDGTHLTLEDIILRRVEKSPRPVRKVLPPQTNALIYEDLDGDQARPDKICMIWSEKDTMPQASLPLASEETDQGAGLEVREADMEKQELVDADLDYEWVYKETDYPFHFLTTRRLIVAIGILCIIGVLSAMHVVGKIQAWRAFEATSIAHEMTG
ncbi:hypothetical protein M426DRAFT_172088 [Hypoxylon sp. CI-4A]|nr:hypothetical protein M426DRAFT_172088 [Hypoxylon sp. CI-4A]